MFVKRYHWLFIQILLHIKQNPIMCYWIQTSVTTDNQIGEKFKFLVFAEVDEFSDTGSLVKTNSPDKSRICDAVMILRLPAFCPSNITLVRVEFTDFIH